MIVERAKQYVKEACQRPENSFGPSFFEEHLMVVAESAKELAVRLNADLEIVELAAYLHDISAILDPKTIPNHAELGGEWARRFLLENGYPSERAIRVARAVASHSTPVPLGGGSLEEICISNADVINRVLRPAYWFYYAFVVRKQSFQDGKAWLRAGIEKAWPALIEPAKEAVGDRYSSMMVALSE
jgi:putative nucleotidyltransferase with HDIG domain